MTTNAGHARQSHVLASGVEARQRDLRARAVVQRRASLVLAGRSGCAGRQASARARGGASRATRRGEMRHRIALNAHAPSASVNRCTASAYLRALKAAKPDATAVAAVLRGPASASPPSAARTTPRRRAPARAASPAHRRSRAGAAGASRAAGRTAGRWLAPLCGRSGRTNAAAAGAARNMTPAPSHAAPNRSGAVACAPKISFFFAVRPQKRALRSAPVCGGPICTGASLAGRRTRTMKAHR
jgi:hypothetical protein